VQENGSVYVIRLEKESAALKLIFLGTALSKGNKKIEIFRWII